MKTSKKRSPQWTPKRVETCFLDTPRRRQKQLLTEIARILYTDFCQFSEGEPSPCPHFSDSTCEVRNEQR